MAGAAYGGYDSPKLTYSGYVKMWQGSNKISILSAAVGLPVSSPHRKFRIFILHCTLVEFQSSDSL
jgi:hypothetical protein